MSFGPIDYSKLIDSLVDPPGAPLSFGPIDYYRMARYLKDTGLFAGDASAYVFIDSNGDYVAVDGITRNQIYRGPSASMAIQSAVDYVGERGGGTVRIGDGEYPLEKIGEKTEGIYDFGYAFWVRHDNVKVIGSGALLRIVSDDTAIILGHEDKEYKGIRLSGLIIDGSDASYSKSFGMVVTFRLNNFMIDDNIIRNAPIHGIHMLFDTKNGIVLGNLVENIPYQGISLDGTKYVVVTGNVINGARTGVNQQVNSDIESLGYDPVPRGNILSFNKINDINYGVVVSGGVGFTIMGNNITNNRTTTDAGIKVQHYYASAIDKYYKSSSFSILGNVFYNIRTPIIISGTEGYESERGSILGNVALRGPIGLGYFILFNNSRYLLIAGNTCRDPASGVYHIYEGVNADYNIIIDNNVPSVSISGPHTYCDICIYESLPDDIAVKPKPIIYYDGANYYIAALLAGVWRKALLE